MNSAAFLATMYLPERSWEFDVGDWRFGVSEYVYPIPQGEEQVLRETVINYGPSSISTQLTPLQLGGVVLLAFAVALFLVAWGISKGRLRGK